MEIKKILDFDPFVASEGLFAVLQKNQAFAWIVLLEPF